MMVTMMITKNAIKVNNTNFSEVKHHIENGKSVFIDRKGLQEETPIRISEKEFCEPWYFTHV